MGMILAFLCFEEFANIYDKSHFANAIVLYIVYLPGVEETLSLYFHVHVHVCKSKVWYLHLLDLYFSCQHA